MKLIIGLGNKGEKYANTRHNLGFTALDAFLEKKLPDVSWHKEDKFESLVVLHDFIRGGLTERVIFAKPQTYMNNSGKAVAMLARYYDISPENICIVYDELDLPLGTIKIKKSGSSAGHNGVQSVINHLQTEDFWRIRMGIGVTTQEEPSEHFVLSRFSKEEETTVTELIKKTGDILDMILQKGMTDAQNQYNKLV